MQPMALRICLLLTILVVALVNAQDDNEKSHSTSTAGMVNLLQLEAKLLENLNSYADEMEKKLKEVRSFVSGMRFENDKANNRTLEYLSNPLNAFSLIRRMHQDWLHWEHFMREPVGQRQLDYIAEQRHQLPSSTDLEEAAASLHRIQSTYDLEISDMVKGLLIDKQYDVSMNGLDSYTMGKYLFDQKNFGVAGHWLYQAILWLDAGYKLPLPLKIEREEISHIYAETLIEMRRFSDAVTVLSTAIETKKDNLRLSLRKFEVETMIRTHPNASPKPYLKPSVTDYEVGCRGQFKASSKLYCVYNNTNSPFLRLAPLKLELVSLDPYMMLYHDVISSSEIKELQELATPSLKRASVFNIETGKNTVVKSRTSKVTWLTDTHNKLTARLNRRITDMTRFNLEGSEMLQVMNYGLGGHYEQHYDWFNTSIAGDLTKMNGDRIATVLFYLTDVEQGGATVFPTIQKAIFPQRGTAIIWYNLRSDGNGDPLTLHAACPVIVGSKWVCNKWIRERQQLFKRPCFQE